MTESTHIINNAQSGQLKSLNHTTKICEPQIKFRSVLQGGRIKMRSPPKVLTGNFRPSQLSFFLS